MDIRIRERLPRSVACSLVLIHDKETGRPVPVISPATHPCCGTPLPDNVNQTQSDKPVENPGIAARFTLGPEAVVGKVRHAFISEKPKMRYPVTLVTRAVMVLKRLLPGRVMDKILQG